LFLSLDILDEILDLCALTEHSNSVVDGDQDDVVVEQKLRAIQLGAAGAGREAAAVHPDHDWKAFRLDLRRKQTPEKCINIMRALETIERREMD
jgi:hypothetical protein